MNIATFFSQLNLTKNNIKLIFAVFILYIFFLLINIPASFVFSTMDLPKNVKTNVVSGSIWSGKVRQLTVSGVSLGSISWQLHPLSLLIGNITADVSAVNNKQYINSEISISLSGKVELEETRFKFDLESLQPLIYGMPITYSGKASGYFPFSYFQKNNYVAVNGKLSLSSINMISPQLKNFGDFIVDFRAEKEGGTSGKIKDSGGELSLDGKLNLNKNGLIHISTKLAARESGSSIDNVLGFLGRKDSKGQINITNSFNLWQ